MDYSFLFILAYLHFPNIRAMAAERALAQKKIKEAKELAEEGLKEKTRDFHEWKKVWYALLLKAAEKEHASGDIRKYAEKIFLDYQDFDYYDKLKKTFASKEWAFKVQEFLEGRRTTLGIHTLLHICIREERWPEFLAFLKEHCSLDLVIQYDKYLAEHFPQELQELYGEQIRKGLAANTGRKYYEHISDILRRMKKLPKGKRIVQRLIDEFVHKYGLRTAMKDEFAKV